MGSLIFSVSARVTVQPFKVIDFGTERKRVCGFLLVHHSNLGPILHRFGDIAGFFVLLTTPLFHPNFWGVPIAPDRPCWVNVSRCLKLFGREIIFEVFQPMRSRYLNVTDGQTDGETDSHTGDTLSHNRALRSIAR